MNHFDFSKQVYIPFKSDLDKRFFLQVKKYLKSTIYLKNCVKAFQYKNHYQCYNDVTVKRKSDIHKKTNFSFLIKKI